MGILGFSSSIALHVRFRIIPSKKFTYVSILNGAALRKQFNETFAIRDQNVTHEKVQRLSEIFTLINITKLQIWIVEL